MMQLPPLYPGSRKWKGTRAYKPAVLSPLHTPHSTPDLCSRPLLWRWLGIPIKRLLWAFVCLGVELLRRYEVALDSPLQEVDNLPRAWAKLLSTCTQVPPLPFALWETTSTTATLFPSHCFFTRHPENKRF